LSTAVTSLISLVVMLVIAFTALGSVFDLMGSTGDTQTAQLEHTYTVGLSDVVASAAATSTRLEGHSDLGVTVTNRGALSYASFSSWDVIAHYTHVGGGDQSVRLSYATPLVDNSWNVAGIYLDADASIPELLESGLLNPEEEVVFNIRLSPPAQPGSNGRLVIMPPEGPPTNISFPNPLSLYTVDKKENDWTVFMYSFEGVYQGYYSVVSYNRGNEGITCIDHSLFLVDKQDNEMYQYTPGPVLTFRSTWALDGENSSAAGTTTDGANFWIVDDRDDVVYKYDMDGAFISASSLRAGNNNSQGITTNGDSIWVVNGSGSDSVFKYDMDMGFLVELPLAAGNNTPMGITTDGANIWVADDGTDSIYTYDMSMNLLSQFPLAAENGDPTGMTVLPR